MTYQFCILVVEISGLMDFSHSVKVSTLPLQIIAELITHYRLCLSLSCHM